MPTSAEEEAERLKNEREAAAAKHSDQHQAVIASTLPNGMVKEQMQAQAERPDAREQSLDDYHVRQAADAEREKRFAIARENNPPHRTIQHSELIAADNAKAVAENITAEKRQKEEAARQEATKTADHDKAETAKAEQAKTDQHAKEETTRQETAKAADIDKSEHVKVDERAKEEQRKGADKSQQGIAMAGAPSAFAQTRAEHDYQRAQTQDQQRQHEAEAGERRFANRREVVPERYQPLRDCTEREQSDWRQRQAARAEQRPAREETEKQQSLANNGKKREQDGNER